MAKQKTVIDASILVKWFAKESGSDQALLLRDEHVRGLRQLIVPELVFLEVLNALRYKGMTIEQLDEMSTLLWNIQLQVIPLSPHLLSKAAKCALEHQLSVYDATYVALSLMFGCPLITDDKTLAQAPNGVMLMNIK